MTDTTRPTDDTMYRPPRTDYATEYTRDTEEITPGVPMFRESAGRPDGGTPRTRRTASASVAERPPDTDYATKYTRDTEEITPGVADLR